MQGKEKLPPILPPNDLGFLTQDTFCLSALAVDDLHGAADASERVARVGGAADEEVHGELVHAVEALGRPVFDGEGGGAFDEAERG